MAKNWREIKEGQTIFKFDSKKSEQTLVLKFLGEGVIKSFNTPIYNEAHVITGYKDSESVEFQVELNGKIGSFSSGSSRLLTALQDISNDLTNKRIKMVKSGIGMDTLYSAELVK